MKTSDKMRITEQGITLSDKSQHPHIDCAISNLDNLHSIASKFHEWLNLFYLDFYQLATPFLSFQ